MKSTVLRRPPNASSTWSSPKKKKTIQHRSGSTHKRERTVVIMYHKPPNVITSHSNADEVPMSIKGSQGEQVRRRTVYEDICSMGGFVVSKTRSSPSHDVDKIAFSESPNSLSFEKATGIKSKMHAVGRLDADTTGLLFLTNDGALVHRITNPTSTDRSDYGYNTNDILSENTIVPMQKTYEAVIMGYHSLPSDTQQSSNSTYPLLTLLQHGVTLPQKHGGQTRPVDALSILSHPSQSTTRVSITISEGKNRQIRRMFHAVGSGVMKLHRKRVGSLNLRGLTSVEEQVQQENSSIVEDKVDGELKEGEWRLLTEEEVEKGLGWKCRYLDEDHDWNGAKRASGVQSSKSRIEGKINNAKRRDGTKDRKRKRKRGNNTNQA